MAGEASTELPSTLLRPGSCSPTQATFELGADSKWGLHHLQRGSETSAHPSYHSSGPGKESLSMLLLYSAPHHQSPVHRASMNHGDLL